MMRVFVEGIGVVGPGLDGWTAARPVLAGTAGYVGAPVRLPPIALLPPAERRRAGTTVKLAIAAGIEALAQSGRDSAEIAMVFAASGGDGETVHQTLSVLATTQREVSPTRFHNSVHNAPSGYWSVATGSRAPSTSICAFDDSFAAGMLEAAVQATVQDGPVTLVVYDVPYPEPLHTARPIVAVFGMAMVLAPGKTDRGFAALTLATPDVASPATTMVDPDLEHLRLGNPAARALPVLAAIARGAAEMVRLAGIEIEVTPA
jgi:hypothetical protein